MYRSEKRSWKIAIISTGPVLLFVALLNAQEDPVAKQSARTTGPNSTQVALPEPDAESELARRIRKGASMEDIAELRDPIAQTPAEAIKALKEGNARFFGGQARRPEMAANERRSQILGQTPFAVIVGCADSRVPTEIVFDQSLGSLFVVRVAGNLTVPITEGSVEYAIAHLKSHVIVVMGHEGCGAVAAAMLSDEQLSGESENVRHLVEFIQPSVEGLPAIRDQKARMREAVISNIRLQVQRMNDNPVIAERVKAGKLKVIGAYYEIGSGAVDFLETEEELRVES